MIYDYNFDKKYAKKICKQYKNRDDEFKVDIATFNILVILKVNYPEAYKFVIQKLKKELENG